MRTIVYADGGCDPNPGPGGWGVVIQAETGTIELCGGERSTTNNRMELTAAISALSHFPEGAALEMRCDSQYVIKSVTEWMKGWKAKGWRTSTGPVKNVDLMQTLDTLAARRDVRWTWVRGHTGEAGNERADRLAAQGRRQALAAPAGSAVGTATTTTTLPASVSAAPIPSPPAPARLTGTAALAAAMAAPPRTTPIPVDLALGLDVSRAAKAAGLTAPAFVEEAIRVALHLGPEAFARAREAAKGAKLP
ncbi:ribonuclease H [Methylobacterium sp. Leaf102]|uniref:ribonuclease HI n=1 Tax=Methylobacterium sp. Leaf102 TaxID=1736253 RepID=UPI0006F416C0|nr:ribonuclease HI [Methylobacterium sp. Leaf102]KQP28247.1 ribonuclease H [Methylobacterium sp. Leaf102]